MSQIPSPPDGVPDYRPAPPSSAEDDQRGRWSSAAVTGFVLSLLGCTGVAAIPALILGIVGIFKTRGGRRRGFGLAVAAVPISLVTLVLFLLGLAALQTFQSLSACTGLVADAWKAPEAASAVPVVRGAFTEEFNAAVSDGELQAWLEQIRASHGVLVEFPDPSSPAGPVAGELDSVMFGAKFINGNAAVKLTLVRKSMTEMAIGDISVDGVSPMPGDEPEGETQDPSSP